MKTISVGVITTNDRLRSVATGLPRPHSMTLMLLLPGGSAEVQVSTLPAHTSYPACEWLRCRVKSTRAQGLTTPRQMVRCPSQPCHNRAYKKSLLDQSHCQLRHPTFPLVVRRVCCLSQMATAKRSLCMVRIAYGSNIPFTGCTTIYHFMTTNDNLEALQEPALMQADDAS